MRINTGRLGLPMIDAIHHCRAEDLLCALPDDCIDLIVTSPPYDNLRDYSGFDWSFNLIALESYRVLKPGGVMVWVVRDATIDGSETLTSMRQALYFKDVVGFKMHDTMIFNKGSVTFPDANRYHNSFEYMFILSKASPATFNPQLRINRWAGDKLTGHDRQKDGRLTTRSRRGGTYPNKGWHFNVWSISVGWMKTTKDKFAFDHPAMFPEKLAERHILTWSNPGDIVLDFFMGSGTTAKMARNNDRHYIGCDISEEYVELALRRLALPYNLQMFG